jgi:hypothetical protein
MTRKENFEEIEPVNDLEGRLVFLERLPQGGVTQLAELIYLVGVVDGFVRSAVHGRY